MTPRWQSLDAVTWHAGIKDAIITLWGSNIGLWA
jgi:hypothetical protein